MIKHYQLHFTSVSRPIKMEKQTTKEAQRTDKQEGRRRYSHREETPKERETHKLGSRRRGPETAPESEAQPSPRALATLLFARPRCYPHL